MREKLLMDYGWKFKKEEDIIDTKSKAFISSTKTGTAGGHRGVNYYDADWDTVDLPHDWVVYEDFSKTNNNDQGYLPQGVVWYRKSFLLDNAYRDKSIYLVIDGVAIKAEVYLNGQLIRRSFSGYTGFCIDITDCTQFNNKLNCLAIKADNMEKEGWWYEGGGIFRHTWLVVTDKLHIKNNGVYVNPQKKEDDISNLWEIPIETIVENRYDSPCNAKVISSIINKSGVEVIKQETEFTCAAKGEAVIMQNCTLSAPDVWSIYSPVLYTLETRILFNNEIIDEEQTSFGFRTIEFTQDKGFFLNDQSIKIKGVCIHHDHAGVGVALPDAVHCYRVKRLKEMGCNAIRTAHNPPSVELLEVCDRLGMLVMDEVRHLSSTEQGLYELSSLVRRDRNHPSVILWSVFNEEPLQCTDIGERIVKTMKSEIRKLDMSRPVTGSMNGPLEKYGAVHQLDVMGINYSIHTYDDFHARYPHLPVIASETGSHLGSRGIYDNNEATGHVSAYGTEKGINLYPWSSTPGEAWKPIAERDYIAGGFFWTGFDYRGETGPYDWPGVTSNFGCMDICGFPKDDYYWHQALWLESPVLKISPHWNWKTQEGENIKVVCYSNCEEIELFLNNISLGKKKCDVYTLPEWQVIYKPGELKAIGYNDGNAIIEDMERTTDTPNKLKLECDREVIKADGEDVCIVNVSILDCNGYNIPNSMEKIFFRLEGPGKIIGVGNGDNSSHECDKSNERSLFNGLAQVIVQSTFEEGTIMLFAIEEHGCIEAAKIDIRSQKAEQRLFLSSVPGRFMVHPWRMSFIVDEKPSPEEFFHNQYTWIPTVIGMGTSPVFSGEKGYCVLHGKIHVPHTELSKTKPKIVFEGIMGKAEFYMDKKLIAKKDSEIEMPFIVQNPHLAAGDDTEILVIIRLNGSDCGITGDVFLDFD